MPLGFEHARDLVTRGLSALDDFGDKHAAGPEFDVAPFRPGEFSYGAEIAKLGSTLISSARSRRAYSKSLEKQALETQYQQAQIDNLRSEIAARKAKQQYSLEVPGDPLPAGVAGPPQPKTMTFDSHVDYDRERDYRYPAVKDPDPGGFKKRGLDLRERAIGAAASRTAAAGQRSDELTAANQELQSIDEEGKRSAETLAVRALAEGAALRRRAIHGRSEDRNGALRTLGLPEGESDNDLIQRAAEEWSAQRKGFLTDSLNTSLDPRRKRARAVTQRHAGLTTSPAEELLKAIEGMDEE